MQTKECVLNCVYSSLRWYPPVTGVMLQTSVSGVSNPILGYSFANCFGPWNVHIGLLMTMGIMISMVIGSDTAAYGFTTITPLAGGYHLRLE